MMSQTYPSIDSLKLMAGTPIPVESSQLVILQPTLKDIAYMGESRFYSAISYLLVNKNLLQIQEDISDFDIFLYLILTNVEIRELMVEFLYLIVENAQHFHFLEDSIKIDSYEEGQSSIINASNFLSIKEIVKQIFCLEQSKADFNPANEAARKIAEKLQKRKEKLSSQKEKVDSILPNLVSILSTGANSISLKDALDMTIFQLYNIFKRFGMYSEYTIQTQALMQGAENIELVEWTKKI